MAQTAPKKEPLYSQDQVQALFQRLTVEDHSKCLSVAMRFTDDKDDACEFLHEAIVQTLAMDRKWVKGVPLEAHLHMSIKGIRSNGWRHQKTKRKALAPTRISQIGETLHRLLVGGSNRDITNPDELLDAKKIAPRSCANRAENSFEVAQRRN